MDWLRNGAGLVILALLVLVPAYARADSSSEQEAADHEHHETHGHRHHIGVFLGGTRGEAQNSHDPATHSEGSGHEDTTENGFTLGVDYQYRVHRFFGVGGIYDHAFGDARTTVVAPGVFFRPFGGAQILAAPGVELHGGHKEFVFRLGFYYEFELNRLSLAPTFAIDFLEERQAYVYGLTIGFGF